MSGLIDKVKQAVSSDKSSQPEGTHGPHQTRAANAADPRIDSDRDHRARQDIGRTGENYPSTTGDYHTGSGAYGSESRPFNTTDGPATKTDGPHKSNILNKADPRVDSDRDYSKNMGANPHGTSGTGSHNVASETTAFGTGTGRSEGLRSHGVGSEGYSSNIPEGTYGPHGSRVANAADPRVDSDLDRNRNTGTGFTGENLTSGTHGTHGTHGRHGTETLGNSGATFGTENRTENLGTTGAYGSSAQRGENFDTTGDSFGTGRDNLDTSGTTYGSNTTGQHHQGGLEGTGPAPNTAGPHKSDMLNKMDPRVDSNLDGSKTMGGDKTFSRS